MMTSSDDGDRRGYPLITDPSPWIVPDDGSASQPRMIFLRCGLCPWRASGTDHDAVHVEGRAHVETHRP